MSTNPGSRLTATGLAFMFLAFSAGVGFGAHGLLFGFVGVIAGANFIFAGVGRMCAEPTTPTFPAVFARLSALMAFLSRHLALAGLILSSSAVTAVAGGEVGPILCCGTFALFLLGLYLIIIPVLGEE